MTATDMADYLVGKDVPFREAHAIVGKTVAYCIEKNMDLTDLSMEELRGFASEIEDDIIPLLTVKGSVDSRISTGGTSMKCVKEAVAKAEKALGL